MAKRPVPYNGGKGCTVGYGRPPAHSRFKPGQSGNPHGRPRHSRNVKTVIQNALISRITVREGEKHRSMSRLEGVVLRQIERALKGSDRAALATLKIAAQVGLLEDGDTAVETPVLTPAEQELVDDLLRQVAEPARRKQRRRRKS